MYARLRCGGNLPLCLAFGTGEGLLRYGRDIRCQKRFFVKFRAVKLSKFGRF